jgi:hypothetical protein
MIGTKIYRIMCEHLYETFYGRTFFFWLKRDEGRAPNTPNLLKKKKVQGREALRNQNYKKETKLAKPKLRKTQTILITM